jgi:hypothetical protein
MLWKKMWLLFTVIWVVVSALNAGTILAFSEEHEKALRPIILGVAVPALLYLMGLGWQRLRRKPEGSDRG